MKTYRATRDHDPEIWSTNELSPMAAPTYSFKSLQVTAQGWRAQEDPYRLPELGTQI